MSKAWAREMIYLACKRRASSRKKPDLYEIQMLRTLGNTLHTGEVQGSIPCATTIDARPHASLSLWQRALLHAARGIPPTRICPAREKKLSYHRPEVLTASNYWCDEPIEGG